MQLSEGKIANPWMTDTSAAKYLNVTVASVRKWRSKNIGPAYTRLPTGMVRYSQVEIDNWLEAHKHICDDSQIKRRGRKPVKYEKVVIA